MAGTWTETVTLDADKVSAQGGGIGYVTVTFTDSDHPEYGTFTYSDRVHADAAGRDAFLNAAIAARQAWRTKRAAEIADEANVAARILQLDTSI